MTYSKLIHILFLYFYKKSKEEVSYKITQY